MVTNENSIEGENVYLYYYGMVSFANENITVSGFEILVKYRGSTIAEALSSTTPNFTVWDSYREFNSSTIDFYPKNEGEIATYVFSWVFDNETY